MGGAALPQHLRVRGVGVAGARQAILGDEEVGPLDISVAHALFVQPLEATEHLMRAK